ncbi:MAG: Gfo/Idh/MocA family protein [Nocardioidaceae bacterium]
MVVDQTSGLAVGMVGYAFMGAAHSQAWSSAPRFFELPLRPYMAILCGRDNGRLTAAAERLGWASTETDWRSLVTRPDVDVVDICTPGDSHAEIAVAALDAGKHVLCEKPLATNVAEAQEMVRAAERARERGIRSMVGFTYRRVPAIGLARRLVAGGRLGEIRHVRAQYLQDWLVDPDAPLSWRLQKDRAGSGALGDIGAHVIDLTQYIIGEQIVGVSGMLDTFVKKRPVPTESSGLTAVAGEDMGEVTVDDSASFLARFGGGAPGVFEATRCATGRKNAIRIEVNGTQGSVAFDFEDMNLLHFYDATQDADTAGFRRIVVTEPEHPYVGAWWPPGHLLGYEHAFTHQVVDLVNAISAGEDPSPSFAEGLHVQRVLEAVEQSAEKRCWREVGA